MLNCGQITPWLPLTRELSAKLTEGEKLPLRHGFAVPPPLTSVGSCFQLVEVISTS